MPPLRFLIRGACAAPHKEKLYRGGEDAFFLSHFGLGVADGVGGWADAGINPAVYARKLMSSALSAITGTTNAALSPAVKTALHALSTAYAEAHKARLQGSCTAALCLVNDDRKALDFVHVGDCGIVVMRAGAVVYRSKEQQEQFNFPLQLGTQSPTTPDHGERYTLVPAQPYDLVLLGSDGLFDNLFDDHIEKEMQLASKGSPASIVDCSKLATQLVVKAYEHSQDPRKLSPFSAKAAEHGLRYQGGKPDDITAVIGQLFEGTEKGLAEAIQIQERSVGQLKDGAFRFGGSSNIAIMEDFFPAKVSSTLRQSKL